MIARAYSAKNLKYGWEDTGDSIDMETTKVEESGPVSKNNIEKDSGEGKEQTWAWVEFLEALSQTCQKQKELASGV